MLKIEAEAILTGLDAGKIAITIGSTTHYVSPAEAETLAECIPSAVFALEGIA